MRGSVCPTRARPPRSLGLRRRLLSRTYINPGEYRYIYYCDDDDGKQKEGLLDFLKRHPDLPSFYSFLIDSKGRQTTFRFFSLAAASFDF